MRLSSPGIPAIPPGSPLQTSLVSPAALPAPGRTQPPRTRPGPAQGRTRPGAPLGSSGLPAASCRFLPLSCHSLPLFCCFLLPPAAFCRLLPITTLSCRSPAAFLSLSCRFPVAFPSLSCRFLPRAQEGAGFTDRPALNSSRDVAGGFRARPVLRVSQNHRISRDGRNTQGLSMAQESRHESETVRLCQAWDCHRLPGSLFPCPATE